jgi:ribosomal protein S18 acetylase RimI-like enzyme
LIGIKEVEIDEYFISNLAVLPERQGRGLGKFLLQQVENQAMELGFHKLSLTVDVENPRAISLYQQTGFRLIQTIEIEPLRKLIGYGGFHRMLKDLS